jgi:hypothetical protein
MLKNYVYKLSIGFSDYTLLITGFHCWINIIALWECHVMSCHVMSVFTQQDRVCAHSAIWNKQIPIHTDVLYHGTQFTSCQLERSATANNSKILSHSTNMQHATHSKTVLLTTWNNVTCYKSHTVPLVWTHFYCSMIYYAHQHVCPYVSSDYFANGMTYYTLHSKMASPQYACADVASDYSVHQMTYYIHHT